MDDFAKLSYMYAWKPSPTHTIYFFRPLCFVLAIYLSRTIYLFRPFHGNRKTSSRDDMMIQQDPTHLSQESNGHGRTVALAVYS